MTSHFDWIRQHEEQAKAKAATQRGSASSDPGMANLFNAMRWANFDAADYGKDLGIVIGGALDDMAKAVSEVLPGKTRLEIPGFSAWRRKMRSLEWILLMLLLYSFMRDEQAKFRDLETAAHEGHRRLNSLVHDAPRLRQALNTIFLYGGPDASRRFLQDLKRRAPPAFWQFIWTLQ